MSEIEMSKEYRTKDGRPVRLLCTDGPGSYPVVAIIYDLGGDASVVTSWTSDGVNIGNGCSYLDLVEVRKKFKREIWVNVYPEGMYGGDVSAYSTKNVADRMALNERIARIKVIIEGEEGEGL